MSLIIIEKEAYDALIVKIMDIEAMLNSFDDAKQGSVLWFDSFETAKILHICLRTLQKLRNSRQINYSRIGGKSYYKQKDIDNYLNKRAENK